MPFEPPVLVTVIEACSLSSATASEEALSCSVPREKSLGPLITTLALRCAPSSAPSQVRSSCTLNVSAFSSYTLSSLMVTLMVFVVSPPAMVTCASWAAAT